MEKQVSSNRNRLKMPSTVSKDIMEAIIKSIYTGIFSLNPTNFEKIFQTAKLLKMHLLITALEIRLKQMMSLKKNLTKNSTATAAASAASTSNASSSTNVSKINTQTKQISKFLMKSKNNSSPEKAANDNLNQNEPLEPTVLNGGVLKTDLGGESDQIRATSDTMKRKLSNCDESTTVTNAGAVSNPRTILLETDPGEINGQVLTGEKKVRFSSPPVSNSELMATKPIKDVKPAKKRKVPESKQDESLIGSTHTKNPRNSIYTTEPVKKLTSSDVFRKYRYVKKKCRFTFFKR